jgi:transcriptional regulator with GAF, ATPase, and Fis domain
VETGDTITAGGLGLGGAERRAAGEPTRRPTPFGLPSIAVSGSGGGATGTGGAPSLLEPTPRPATATPAANEAERAAIEEALTRVGGVVAKAAAEMGLSRQALYRRMERLGIVMERRPR